jgi:hypothetical protein
MANVGRILVKTRSIFAFLLLFALAQPGVAQETARFGVVAISAGQTAEVIVANTMSSPHTPPCHLSIEFADRNGNSLGDSNAGNFALAPGNIASLAIADPYLLPGERFHIRVQVRKMESKAAGRNECGMVRTTVEIFDTETGKTTVLQEYPDD